MRPWMREAWRNYACAWRRLGHDRRAWIIVLRGTFLVLAVPYCLLVLTGALLPGEQRSGQVYFNAFVFGTGFLAFLILRRGNRRDSALLNTSITGESHGDSSPTPAVSPAVREHLADRIRIISALFARACDEHALSLRIPLNGRTGLRQLTNRMLKELDLWAKLEPFEQELASQPSGTWPDDRIVLATEWAEQLRLLRWIFRLDEELLPLSAFPRPDARLCEGLVGADIFPRDLRPVWDVRAERDEARVYLARAGAELEARGLRAPWPVTGHHRELRERLIGPSTDLIAGILTVGELRDGDVSQFAAIAAARFRYSSYLTDVLAGPASVSFPTWLDAPVTGVDRAMSGQ